MTSKEDEESIIDISMKNGPNQFNSLNQLKDFSTEQELTSKGKINAA